MSLATLPNGSPSPRPQHRPADAEGLICHLIHRGYQVTVTAHEGGEHPTAYIIDHRGGDGTVFSELIRDSVYATLGRIIARMEDAHGYRLGGGR